MVRGGCEELALRYTVNDASCTVIERCTNLCGQWARPSLSAEVNGVYAKCALLGGLQTSCFLPGRATSCERPKIAGAPSVA